MRRGETTDVRTTPQRPVHITLRTPRANAVLGTAIRPDECAAFLRPLGFEPVAEANASFDVLVPTWRPDCHREIDLIEEVARIYGYENIPRALPPRPATAIGLTDYQKGRRRTREVLAGAGANEAWTNTFLSDTDLAQAGLDPSVALEVENPLDRSQRLLRTSLLPGLLNAARFNVERQAGAFSLFEIGSVFRLPVPGYPGLVIEGVMEWEQLGLIAVGGAVDGAYAAKTWEVLAAGLRLDRPSVGPMKAGDNECSRQALSPSPPRSTRPAGPSFRAGWPRRRRGRGAGPRGGRPLRA